jgi:hypothetical protein
MTSNILSPFVPCHATIYLDKDNRSNTYCVRERGHEGEHNIVNAPPAQAVLKEEAHGQAA